VLENNEPEGMEDVSTEININLQKHCPLQHLL